MKPKTYCDDPRCLGECGLPLKPPKYDSFEAFTSRVKASVEDHARRKNYTDGGANEGNKMIAVMVMLGIHAPHSIGEIIYKCAEYMKAPRRVLLEKVAGWAYCLWRETKED